MEDFNKLREEFMSDKAEKDHLVDEASAFAMANGFCVSASLYDKKSKEDNPKPAGFTHAPFALLPTAIREEEYNYLRDLSRIFHKLVDKVSRDSKFLLECVDSAAKSDPDFTGKIAELYKMVTAEGTAQKYELGIFRNDFMRRSIDESSAMVPRNGIDHSKAGRSQWAQIELNTIAAAGGSMSDRVVRLHNHLLSRHLSTKDCKVGWKYPKPTNNAGLAKALATAANTVHTASDSCVLFVVLDNEVNSGDQRTLEYELWREYGVAALRRSLSYVSKHAILRSDKTLQLDNKAISVVYYRSGYSPNHYPSKSEWNARLLMERSTAIKCPSLGYHLVGLKRMQHVFCDTKVLSKYLSPIEIKSVLPVFAGLWTVDQISDKVSNMDALRRNPDLFVLKPMREGGGYNIYGKDIVTTMDGMKANEKDLFILMERIRPQPFRTIQVRNMHTFDVSAIAEFGVFSSYLSDGNDDKPPLLNDVIGTLVRTKPSDVDQGGVFSGFAVFDSFVIV